jgi:hypothetical protein
MTTRSITSSAQVEASLNGQPLFLTSVAVTTGTPVDTSAGSPNYTLRGNETIAIETDAPAYVEFTSSAQMTAGGAKALLLSPSVIYKFMLNGATKVSFDGAGADAIISVFELL